MSNSRYELQVTSLSPLQLTGDPQLIRPIGIQRTMLCKGGSAAENAGADCRSDIGVIEKKIELEPSPGRKFGSCVAPGLDLIP
jgi:hypothetical protein